MLFSVSETQIQWQFRKMEDLVEPTASVLSHHYLISLQLVLLCHFSFFMFVFFYPELSLLTDPELSFFLFCVASEREQDQRSEASPAIGDSRNDVGLSPGWVFYFFLFLSFFLFCFCSSSRWVFALSFFSLFFFLFFLSLFFTLVSSLIIIIIFFFLQAVMVEMAEFGSPI